MEPKSEQLINECLRQSESCQYTSTTFYIWLRSVRRYKQALIILPIIFGGLATWSILAESGNECLKFFAALCALLAAIIPATYEALKLDIDINQVASSAAIYKKLQDRFRLSANMYSLKPYEEFETEVLSLMEELDSARSNSLTPPERFFKAAQKKIKSGDYNFQIDIEQK